MGMQPEKQGARKNDTGKPVFPETDPISLFFRFAYITFVTQRQMEILKSRGGQQS